MRATDTVAPPVIAQTLNRAFLLGAALATANEIEREIGARNADVGGAPSPLDVADSVELAATAQWLRTAVAEADQPEPEPRPAQFGKLAPTPKDDFVFMPRSIALGLFQALFEGFVEDEGIALERKPTLDDRRAGPQPIVTDVMLAGNPLQLTPDGRRVFGRFEVTHPKYLSDPRWILSLVERTKVLGRRASFVDHPADIGLGDPARVIFVGDWGSGLPRALDVGDRIRAELEAAPAGVARHLVHLGDVYYSGTEREYAQRFLAPWPATAGDGTRSYALNGNHDMYSGGFAYFGRCLTDPRFADQRGASYFRLANEHWQLLALDTSYDDQDVHGSQASWADHHLAAFAGRSILLSHHQLFSPYESTAPGVRAKLAPVLERRAVAGWFWAHEHRCLVYRDHEHLPFASCIGHGGIPEYLIEELDEPPSWLAYEYRKVHSTDRQPWDTFGFVVVDFSGEHAHARYIDEDGITHYETESSRHERHLCPCERAPTDPRD